MTLYERRRNLVRRADGTLVNIARFRAQLFVCASGCCCGRTEDGFAAVPTDLYHSEWERRRLRNIAHLSIGGCLGPCALANVVLLLFDGQALWFHSINSVPLVFHLYDYLEAMLDADSALPPPAVLAGRQFTASAWQARPDGQPVEDSRRWGLRRSGREPMGAAVGAPVALHCGAVTEEETPTQRLVADMEGVAAMPRKNGELLFEAPWQGRAFGMAAALHEAALYDWNDFRDRLIVQIATAEKREEPFDYYACWLKALESLLTEKGLMGAEEIEERTSEFEFGERDDVY